MKVIKVSVVYGEETPSTANTCMCIPVISQRFSILVPEGKLILAAKGCISTFAKAIAQIIDKIHEREIQSERN